MIFVLVYVLLSVFCKWLPFANNDTPITSMIYQRWLIEASSFPGILCGTYYMYYVDSIDDLFDKYQSIYVLVLMLKIPLFFVMRYAEYQPYFFLNKIEISMITLLCKRLTK